MRICNNQELMMEGSGRMSSFEISDCSVSDGIAGGEYTHAVIGDLACAVSVDCRSDVSIARRGIIERQTRFIFQASAFGLGALSFRSVFQAYNNLNTGWIDLSCIG